MTIVEKGELYYVDFGVPRGSEQGGYRPVVIVQNDVGNITSPTTIVAPLTSQPKRYLPTHVAVDNEGLRTTSIVLAEQIQTIDKSRLINYLGKLDEKQIEEIDRAMSTALDIKYERNQT